MQSYYQMHCAIEQMTQLESLRRLVRQYKEDLKNGRMYAVSDDIELRTAVINKLIELSHLNGWPDVILYTMEQLSPTATTITPRDAEGA